jgi:hypothetical protein
MLVAILLGGACGGVPAANDCFADADCASGRVCTAGQCMMGSNDGGDAGTGASGNCAPRASLTMAAHSGSIFVAQQCGQDNQGHTCYCDTGKQWQCVPGAPTSLPGQCDSYCIPTSATSCGTLSDGLLAYCDSSSSCLQRGTSYGCCAAGMSCASVCQ